MTDRPDAAWTLDDLTSEAGVTVRTVRYYIAEGLLPPPEGAGRAARYTDDHRNRLDLIASLKDRHLPLREIRQVLRGLTRDEIAEHAVKAREATPPRKVDTLYLRSAPEDHPIRGRAAMPADAGEPDPTAALGEIRSRQEPAPAAAPPEPGQAADQRWHRLAITPEAELLVTEEVWSRRRDQLDTLVAWARRIIGET